MDHMFYDDKFQPQKPSRKVYSARTLRVKIKVKSMHSIIKKAKGSTVTQIRNETRLFIVSSSWLEMLVSKFLTRQSQFPDILETVSSSLLINECSFVHNSVQRSKTWHKPAHPHPLIRSVSGGVWPPQTGALSHSSRGPGKYIFF